MSEKEPSVELDWKKHWGNHATVKLPVVGLDVTLRLTEEFAHSVYHSAVKADKGEFSRKTAKAFLDDAMKAYVAKYKGTKVQASEEELRRLSQLCPAPDQEDKTYQVVTTLEGVKDAEFAKILMARHAATPHGKSRAVREAVFERITQILAAPATA